jgi:mono/diheme cytochrome c family protein
MPETEGLPTAVPPASSTKRCNDELEGLSGGEHAARERHRPEILGASRYLRSAGASAGFGSNQCPARRCFSRANCIGCHKWHGNGGGGYGGDALSLRKTELTREQIIETVGCGRPGTGMPFFTRGAYDEVKCHGMNRQDAGAQMPPEAGTFLRPKDIEAVADYVIAHIKGAGEPTYAECVSFFSSTSRVCDIYKTQVQKPEDATASTGKSQ